MEERGPEREFRKFDQNRLWQLVYHKIREESNYSDLSYKDSKEPENRGRNRYRDVCPYDHSRIHLKRNDLDYINANLVESPPANRRYILTQGPLEHTSGHFWLMVWEQKSCAVLMLNRVMEKGMLKCHQYFPAGGQVDDVDEVTFDDVKLKVSYISEEDCDYYVIRTLQIRDLVTNETRMVQHFHYTTWPDFGVPESPAAFLDFLMAVRGSGALSSRVGPPVIHCSAGIGRSGTFCLVDTCLVLIQQNQSLNSISVIEVLMDMRRYRSGLIQTHEQLRFSYLAIIEGSKRVLQSTPDSGFQERDTKVTNKNGIFTDDLKLPDSSSDDDPIPSEAPPPPPPRPFGTFNDPHTTTASKRQDRPKTASSARGRTPPNPEYLTNNVDHGSTSTAETSLHRRHNNSPKSSPEPSTMATAAATSEGVKQTSSEGFDEHGTEQEPMDRENLGSNPLSAMQMRRRNREGRKQQIEAQLEAMKKKQKELDSWKERKTRVRPYFIGLSIALLVGGVLFYKYYWS